MLNSEKKVVVVLGPPRSGTSVTAGILQILGVDMGNLRSPTFKNPKGLFEDKDFLALTRQIALSTDPSLKNWKGAVGWKPLFPEKVLTQKDKFNRKIRELVEKREKETNAKMWGWKAINTNVQIELFLPYLINPHFIIVFRNLLDIAKSSVDYTKNKENLNIMEALQICKFYYGCIFNFLESHPNLPRIFVSFEDIINNPEKETNLIANFLNIKTCPSKMKKIKYIVIPRNKINLEKRKFYIKKMIKRVFKYFIKHE